MKQITREDGEGEREREREGEREGERERERAREREREKERERERECRCLRKGPTESEEESMRASNLLGMSLRLRGAEFKR